MNEEERNAPAEGSEEQSAGQGHRKEQAAKDLEDSSLSGGAPEPVDSKQESADRGESREEEEKGLLDKVKDKLKGE